MSRSGDIADALAAWLNGQSWPDVGESWTAERTWRPAADLGALSAVKVQVAPDGRDSGELLDRGARQRPWRLFVIVRQRYAASGEIPNDWIDARAALVEAIDDALQDLRLPNQPAGVDLWTAATAITALADPIDLEERRQFTGEIEVTLQEVAPR